MNANELAISVEHVTKRYQLGVIGRGTLRADLQSKIALWRGREDPNSKIGAMQHSKGDAALQRRYSVCVG